MLAVCRARDRRFPRHLRCRSRRMRRPPWMQVCEPSAGLMLMRVSVVVVPWAFGRFPHRLPATRYESPSLRIGVHPWNRIAVAIGIMSYDSRHWARHCVMVESGERCRPDRVPGPGFASPLLFAGIHIRKINIRERPTRRSDRGNRRNDDRVRLARGRLRWNNRGCLCRAVWD